MLDFLGKTLSVDDYVIVIRPKYRELLLAKILGFTPQYARVEYCQGADQHKMLQLPSQLAKVSEADAMWQQLKTKQN